MLKRRWFATALIVFILSGCSGSQSFNAPAVGQPSAVWSDTTAKHQGDVVTRYTKGGQFFALAWDPDDKLLVGTADSSYGSTNVKVVLGHNDGFRFPQYAFGVTYDGYSHAFYFTAGNMLYRSTRGSASTVVTQELGQGGSLAPDGKGKLYVVDGTRIDLVSGSTVKAITRSGSLIVAYGINHPELAFDSKDRTLYFSDGKDGDPEKGSVRRVLPNGKIATVATHFLRPGGIAYDASHDRFIVSAMDGNQLFALTPSGVTKLIAGYGPAAYADGNGWRAFLDQPGAIAYAGDAGVVFFSEDARVASYAVAGPPAPSPAQPTTLFRISKKTPPSGMGSPLIDGASIWFAVNGNLDHLMPNGKLTVVKMPKDVYPIGPMTIDTHGNLWMVYYGPFSTESTGIAERQADGTVTPYFVSTDLGGLSTPAIGPDGNPWFASRSGSGSGGPTVGTIANGKLTMYPVSWPATSVAPGLDGTIWYGTNAEGIGRITTAGAALSPIYTGAAVGVMVPGPANDIWFTGSGQADVYRVTADDRVRAIRVPSATYSIAVTSSDVAWTSVNSGLVSVDASGSVRGYYLPGGSGVTSAVAASNKAIWATTTSTQVILLNPTQYVKAGLPFEDSSK